MFHIDDGFLRDVGLAALPSEVKERYRDAIGDRVLDETIAGARVRLEPEALADFESWLTERERQPALAGAWLQMRCPTFRLVLEQVRLSVQVDIAQAPPNCSRSRSSLSSSLSLTTLPRRGCQTKRSDRGEHRDRDRRDAADP